MADVSEKFLTSSGLSYCLNTGSAEFLTCTLYGGRGLTQSAHEEPLKADETSNDGRECGPLMPTETSCVERAGQR